MESEFWQTQQSSKRTNRWKSSFKLLFKGTVKNVLTIYLFLRLDFIKEFSITQCTVDEETINKEKLRKKLFIKKKIMKNNIILHEV